MFARILKQMREMPCRGEYVMTTHADEEADADEWSVVDVESAILTGAILERQKDQETRERKYVVRGEAIDAWPHLFTTVLLGVYNQRILPLWL